ncbi:hypothetical protein JCM8208_002144 [Rhodotorula glutinis]
MSKQTNLIHVPQASVPAVPQALVGPPPGSTTPVVQPAVPATPVREDAEHAAPATGPLVPAPLPRGWLQRRLVDEVVTTLFDFILADDSTDLDERKKVAYSLGVTCKAFAAIYRPNYSDLATMAVSLRVSGTTKYNLTALDALVSNAIKLFQRVPIYELEVHTLSLLDPANGDGAAFLRVLRHLGAGKASLEVLEVGSIISRSVIISMFKMLESHNHLTVLRLRRVRLAPTHQGEDNMIHPMPSLRYLEISSCTVHMACLIRLGLNLRTLVLSSHAMLDSADIKIIFGMMRTLRHLVLSPGNAEESVNELLDMVIDEAGERTAHGAPYPLKSLGAGLDGKGIERVIECVKQLPFLTNLMLVCTGPVSGNDLEKLAGARPELRILSIRAGTGKEPVEWPSELDEYTASLSKMSLVHFLWDWDDAPKQSRRATTSKIRIKTMKAVGTACIALEKLDFVTRIDEYELLRSLHVTFTRRKTTPAVDTVYQVDDYEVDILEDQYWEWAAEKDD